MPPFYFYHKENRVTLIFQFIRNWPMQYICFHEVCHVGGSLAQLHNARGRLVEQPCMWNQSHYVMWLICFINIGRIFQFPSVNRISPYFRLNHSEREYHKGKTRSLDYLSHRLQHGKHLDKVFAVFSIFLGLKIVQFISLYLGKFWMRSLFMRSLFRLGDLSGLFPQIKTVLWHLSPY